MSRFILAFPKRELGVKIAGMLESGGHSVASVCLSAAALIRAAHIYDDALIMMSFRLRDGTANDVYDALGAPGPIAVIIKPEQLEYIEHRDLFTVALPVNRMILLNAADILAGRVSSRKNRPKRSAADEKIIARAKLRLMEEQGMSEDEAHRFLQKRSMDSGSRIIDMARMILGI